MLILAARTDLQSGLGSLELRFIIGGGLTGAPDARRRSSTLKRDGLKQGMNCDKHRCQ